MFNHGDLSDKVPPPVIQLPLGARPRPAIVAIPIQVATGTSSSSFGDEPLSSPLQLEVVAVLGEARRCDHHPGSGDNFSDNRRPAATASHRTAAPAGSDPDKLQRCCPSSDLVVTVLVIDSNHNDDHRRPLFRASSAVRAPRGRETHRRSPPPLTKTIMHAACLQSSEGARPVTDKNFTIDAR